MASPMGDRRCVACGREGRPEETICPEDGQPLDAAAVGSAETDDPEALAPGTMVGEYRVEARLGAGGFGAVYRAVHPVIGKVAAVKVLRRACSSDPEVSRRFVDEARAVHRIKHGNIVDIFGFGALPVDVFDEVGDAAFASSVDETLIAKKLAHVAGAHPAHVRQARRAATRGDRARAQELARIVVGAWGRADVRIPAVAEMQALLER